MPLLDPQVFARDKAAIYQFFGLRITDTDTDRPRYPWVWQGVRFDPARPNEGQPDWTFPAGGPWYRVVVRHHSGGSPELGDGEYYTGGLVHVECFAPLGEGPDVAATLAGYAVVALNAQTITGTEWGGEVFFQEAVLVDESEQPDAYMARVSCGFTARH